MKWYYPSTGIQTATVGYSVYHMEFKATNLIIVHNGNVSTQLVISWDGSNDHFHILQGEPLNLGNLEFEEIWIKDGAGTTEFRIAAYSK